VSVNFSHALFSLLHFLTVEDGAERLSQNVSKKLPLYAVEYRTRVQISGDDLAMQALVWVCMVQFRVIQFGTVWFGTNL
jgi:hypothetical protein